MGARTIVMYHYVRDLKLSRYPDIKGLARDLFKEQVGYLKKHYNPISAYDLMGAVQSGTELPPNAVLLTFDDGYIDHFTEVFPVLEKEKISGCFFPPTKCILENQVLDVNKIHFVLASVSDKLFKLFVSNDEKEFFKELYMSVDPDKWIMCYPYGAYNETFLSVLKERNCVAGLTTNVGLADLKEHNPLILPRLDTNDMPKDSQAEINEWTKKAVRG